MSEELNNDVVQVETEALPTEETVSEVNPEETDSDITPEETESEIIPEVANAEIVNFEITEGVEEAEWTEGVSKDNAVTVESVLENKLPKANHGVVKLENKEITVAKQEIEVSHRIKETKVDQALVEKAIQKINDIASTHFKSAITEVGQYLVDEFFYGNLELVKQKNGGKLKSLRQVIKLICKKGEKDYSRSWIYNAINLVLQNNAYESVHSYGHLSDGHRIELFRVKDKKQKIMLIEKAASEKLSVSKLKEVIKQGDQQKPNDFVTFLKKVKSVQDTNIDVIFKEYNAENLTKEEYTELMKTIQIQEDKYNKQKITIAATLTKYSEIEKEIKRYSSMVE